MFCVDRIRIKTPDGSIYSVPVMPGRLSWVDIYTSGGKYVGAVFRRNDLGLPRNCPEKCFIKASMEDIYSLAKWSHNISEIPLLEVEEYQGDIQLPD